MNVLLKQVKVMVVVFFSGAGHVVKIKNDANTFLMQLLNGANKLGKEETDKHENKQDFMPGGFFGAF